MHVSEQTCRVCLGKQRLNAIFKKNLPGKIMYCAAVEVSEDDELPKMICNQCLFYLDVAYIFRTVCEATDAKLRKLVEENKRVADLPPTTPVRQDNAEDVVKEPHSEDVVNERSADVNEQRSEDVVSEQHSEDVVKQQNCEDVYFINSPVANEVVIGEEEDDLEVDIVLSACDESSSSVEVENKTSPPMVEIDMNAKISDDCKENKEKIGRHTARKISAKVAKRVPTLGATFISEELQRPQGEKVPENIIKETPPEISQRLLPEKIDESSIERKMCEAPKMHQCNQCNKSFPYKSYLKRHMTVHVTNKKYKCSQCDKKFINQHNLSVHMQTHSGSFPYMCKFCDRGFAWPSLLKRHLNSHTSMAEFQCKYCSKKMLHLSSLKLHEKMHLYRPSYTCDICFKTFAYTNSLATHKKTHKGVKDNVCGICKKQFSRKTSLRRHMLIHLRNKNFSFKVRLKPKIVPKDRIEKRLKCDECSRKFGSKALLLKHLKQHTHK
ncbi:hypothetical protein Zmor_000929 [Zophobas morio]|uniref:Uncharacterized protein n=1 Tax=Zophobas morio TaxID=2755281 RepID=A0AA38J111_9CUCU|nr:hypothetical protein Zmor_000929 [Zophobas morio]